MMHILFKDQPSVACITSSHTPLATLSSWPRLTEGVWGTGECRCQLAGHMSSENTGILLPTKKERLGSAKG